MPFPNLRAEATREAMLDPRPGDVFEEFCTFWVYVAHREGDRVTLIETPGKYPCTLPDDGLWSECTVKQFEARFTYRSIPGFWVQLVRRDDPLPIAWYEWWRAQRREQVKAVFSGL